MIQPKKVSAGSQPIRAVIYGSPGTGKTTLALTFPRPVVIDTNHGLEGGAIEGRDDLIAFEPEGHQDLSDIYFWIKDHTDEYDTIVFDSLDTLVRLLLNEVVDKAETPEANYEIDMVPAIKDYLACQKQVERILSDFRRLGKHLVVTVGARQEHDKDGTPVGKRHISVSPGIQEVVNDWSSLIAEIAVVKAGPDGTPDPKGEEHRILFTNPASEKRECRGRWAALLPHVLDPTFQVIWDKITSKEVK